MNIDFSSKKLDIIGEQKSVFLKHMITFSLDIFFEYFNQIRYAYAQII